MTKIKIEVEFDVDDNLWGATSEDPEEKDWFWNDVIKDSLIIFHSNDVGDSISETDKFKIVSVNGNPYEQQ